MLAPITESARTILSEMFGHLATDQEIMEWQRSHQVECRDLPEKAATLERLARLAREVVDCLADEGVAWAGTREEAAAVICGCAYATWRLGLEASASDSPEKATWIADGLWEGICHARWHAAGMPAELRELYLAMAADSDDPVDRMPLFDVLAELWPTLYGDRTIHAAGMVAAPAAREEVVNAANIMHTIGVTD